MRGSTDAAATSAAAAARRAGAGGVARAAVHLSRPRRPGLPARLVHRRLTRIG